MSAGDYPVHVEMDPVRKAVEKAVDNGDDVTMHRITVRGFLPLPGGKKAEAEVSIETVRIRGRKVQP